MSVKKICILLCLVAAVSAFFVFDGASYLGLDYIKSQQQEFNSIIQEKPVLSAFVFGAIYVLVTALSFPGASVLTLAAGAFFGLAIGTVIVSFASTIGATLAFIAARFIAGDSLQKKYAARLKAINEGIEKEGAFYLFTLRLVPIFPFFLVNIMMGLTKIRIPTFFLVSQIGMLPGTLAYVYAGTALSEVDSLSGILSPNLLLAFAILGIFPLITKKVIDMFRARKIYKNYTKPKQFDYNIVAIGGGAAGLVTSYIASAVKAKVALIEKHKMGGDCLNYGCVPSKALIKSAHIADYIKRAKEFGIDVSNSEVDFAAVMERVQHVVKAIEPHDSVERYTKLGVDCITGAAKILDPWRIEVNGKVITTKNIVVATGGSPLVPPIPGIEDVNYVTSDTVWNLREKPKRMVVLGGGPIGSELSQSFSRLGIEVTQVEMQQHLLGREDDDVIDFVERRFKNEGINLKLGYKAKAFENRNGEQILICEHNGKEEEIMFDIALVALGRKARTTGYGLEELGIDLTQRRTVQADAYLRTNYPNIFVAGDITGPYQFTHVAAHQAWYACVNALFQPFKKFAVDYRVIPWCTFTDPEVARVGHNEKSAQAEGIEYDVTTYGIDDLDRAITEGEAHGTVKVLTVPGKDKILGVTIMGHQGGELLAEYVLAMKYNIGLNKILGTIHSYPTMSEANKYVAGEWKRANAPEWVFPWLEKFHSWRRS